jgi:hypothetical protein
MVTFTRIPYAEAARRTRRQHRIIYAGLIFLTMLILVGLILLFRFIVG